MAGSVKPIIDYLGYSLSKCDYVRRPESGNAKKLFIIVNDISIDENNIASMITKVELTFKNEDICKFDYLSKFAINDLAWYEKANSDFNNLGISNLFSIAFPYIRASISSITNDSLGSIFLPVINVMNGDVTKGLLFTANNG